LRLRFGRCETCAEPRIVNLAEELERREEVESIAYLDAATVCLKLTRSTGNGTICARQAEAVLLPAP